MKNKLKKGFTLIELMVVIAIIGILATVLTPKMREQLAKSKDAKAVTFLGDVRTAVSALAIEDTITGTAGVNGIWKSTPTVEGIDSEIDLTEKGLIDEKTGMVIVGGHKSKSDSSTSYGGELALVNAIDGTRDMAILKNNIIPLKDISGTGNVATNANPSTSPASPPLLAYADDADSYDDYDEPDTFDLDLGEEDDDDSYDSPRSPVGSNPRPTVGTILVDYHGNLADYLENHPDQIDNILKSQDSVFGGFRSAMETYIAVANNKGKTDEATRLREILKNHPDKPQPKPVAPPKPIIAPQLPQMATPTKQPMAVPAPQPQAKSVTYPSPPLPRIKTPVKVTLIKDWNDLHLLYDKNIDERSVEGRKWMDY